MGNNVHGEMMATNNDNISASALEREPRSIGERDKGLIEAALFISAKPLTVSELEGITKLPGDEIIAALKNMEEHFDDHGIKVHSNEDGTYELKIKSEFLKSVKHLTPHSDFSKAELQTLSLIAYDSPIKNSDVIHIRGNRGYDHVTTLLQRGFIRKEPFGHTSLIHLTQKFLDYFGLKTTEEVKRYFAEQGVIVERPKKPDVEKAISEHLEKKKKVGKEMRDGKKVDEQSSSTPSEETADEDAFKLKTM